LIEVGDYRQALTQYEAALELNSNIVTRRSEDAGSTYRLIENQMKIGDIALYLNDIAKAYDKYYLANKMMSQLSSEVPSHKGYKDSLAAMDQRLANVLVQLGRSNEAKPIAEHALELRRTLAQEPEYLEPYARFLLECSVNLYATPHWH